MANFNKAFDFTVGWEGPWDGGNRVIQYEFNDNTASYGITPSFLKDFVGMPNKAITNAFMKSIDRDAAKKIWKASRWTWYKLEDIASDEIAILLFDWAVRRPDPCVKEMAKAFGQPLIRVKYVEYGGNPKDKDAGGFYPSLALIDAINAACQVDGAYDENATRNVYMHLMQRRIKGETNLLEGVKRRLGALATLSFNLNVDNFNSLSAADKQAIFKKVAQLKAAPLVSLQNKTLMTRSMTQPVDEKAESNWGTWALIVLAFYAVTKN